MFFLTCRIRIYCNREGSLNSNIMDNKAYEIIAKWFKLKYAEIDKLMMPYSNVCKRSCDWCCYQSIEILNWEKPLILKYIRKNISNDQFSIIKFQLIQWLKYLKLKTNGKKTLNFNDVFIEFQQNHGNEEQACVFLHQHDCLIYQVRPLCCRMHVAEKDQTFCKKNALNDASPKAKALREKVVGEIVRSVPTRLELLNIAVLPVFGLSLNEIEIEYPLLQDLK